MESVTLKKMKQKVLIAILAILATSIAVVVHFTNDKVWQCERFLSKYQDELETIAEYMIKTDKDTYVLLQEDKYEKEFIPESVKDAMKTYFSHVRYGSIIVLNEASKWRWDNLQAKIPETEFVSFEITHKPYMSYDDAGKKEYRYSDFYFLCYSILTPEQLLNRLSSYRYEVLPTKQPKWFIVIEDQQ